MWIGLKLIDSSTSNVGHPYSSGNMSGLTSLYITLALTLITIGIAWIPVKPAIGIIILLAVVILKYLLQNK